MQEVSSIDIVSLKSQASNVRDQLRQEEKGGEEKVNTQISFHHYRIILYFIYKFQLLYLTTYLVTLNFDNFFS